MTEIVLLLFRFQFHFQISPDSHRNVFFANKLSVYTSHTTGHALLCFPIFFLNDCPKTAFVCFMPSFFVLLFSFDRFNSEKTFLLFYLLNSRLIYGFRGL